MKKLFLMFTLLFLVACSPQMEKNQSVQEVAAINITIEPDVVTPEPVVENKTEEVQQKPIVVTSNVTIAMQSENNQYSIKNKIYTIEVVDVTENEDACLIKVDNYLELIQKGATKTINMVRIHVLDVHAFRSQLEDNDVCQLIIS